MESRGRSSRLLIMRFLKKSGFFIETRAQQKNPRDPTKYKASGEEEREKITTHLSSCKRNLSKQKSFFRFLDAGANGKHRFSSDLNKLLRYVSRAMRNL